MYVNKVFNIGVVKAITRVISDELIFGICNERIRQKILSQEKEFEEMGYKP